MPNTEFLTSIAELVHKTPADYLARFKGEDGEFDEDKFLETFKDDLRTTRKTERENQLKRGVAQRSKDVLARLKTFAPDIEFDDSDVIASVDALKIHYDNQIKALQEAGNGVLKVEDLDNEAIRKLPVFQETWQTKVRENEAAVKARIEEAEQAKKGYEQKALELERSTKGAMLKSRVVQVANELGFNLADAKEDKERYLQQIETLMYIPALHPDRWKLENGTLTPIDSSGEVMKDKDFHPMTDKDVIGSVNPFGIRKFDPTKGSPSPTSAAGAPVSFDMTEYNRRKALLLANGDRAGLAALSRRYAAAAKK